MSLILCHTHGVNLKKRLVTATAVITHTITRNWQTNQQHEANARNSRRFKKQKVTRSIEWRHLAESRITPAQSTILVIPFFFNPFPNASAAFTSVSQAFSVFTLPIQNLCSFSPTLYSCYKHCASQILRFAHLNIQWRVNSLITLISSNLLTIPPFTSKIRPITLFSDNSSNLYSTLYSRQAVWRPCRAASRSTDIVISSYPASSAIF